MALILSDISIVISGLITVILCMSHVTSGCVRRPTRQLIQRPDCIPKPIMNFICVDSCDNSATQREDIFACNVSRFRLGTIRIRCLNQDRVFENRRLAVLIPLECSCGISYTRENEMTTSTHFRSRGTHNRHTRRHRHRMARGLRRQGMANMLSRNT